MGAPNCIIKADRNMNRMDEVDWATAADAPNVDRLLIASARQWVSDAPGVGPDNVRQLMRYAFGIGYALLPRNAVTVKGTFAQAVGENYETAMYYAAKPDVRVIMSMSLKPYTNPVDRKAMESAIEYAMALGYTAQAYDG